MKGPVLQICQRSARRGLRAGSGLGWSLLACVGFAACGVGTLSATPSILDRSPFIPDGFVFRDEQVQPPPPSQEVGALEFRGVYSINDEYFINVFNRRENKGSWVSLNDPSAAFHVTRFDPETNAISLRIDGREQSLQMAKRDWVSTPVAVAPAPTPAVRPAGTGAAAGQSTSAPPPRRRVVRPSRTTTPDPQAAAEAARRRWEELPADRRPPTPPPTMGPPGPPPNFIPQPPPGGFQPPPNLPQGGLPTPPAQ